MRGDVALEVLDRVARVDVRRHLRPVVVGVPRAATFHRVDSLSRSEQRADEVEPEHVLRARGGEGDTVSLRNPVELRRQLGRRTPGPDRLLLDRDDVRPALEAQAEVVRHDAEVARDGDDRDVDAAVERAPCVGLDDHPRRGAQPGDLAEVAPHLVRAACDGADDLDTLLEHQPSHDRAHGTDAVHDRPNRHGLLMTERDACGPALSCCSVTDTCEVWRDDRRMQRRKRMRLPDHDYALPGAYFVTVCASNRECILSRSKEDRVELLELGRIVYECWIAIPEHHRGWAVDEFVVMPTTCTGFMQEHA